MSVVPILDMLVCVIFFLLLGTSFMQLTKQSLPPSSVALVQGASVSPPLAPQLIGIEHGSVLKLMLSWAGASPGMIEREAQLDPTSSPKQRDSILKAAREISAEFVARYPKEKALRIGLDADVAYQTLITVMDGVKESIPDMVLFSYNEARERAEKSSHSERRQ